MSQRTSANVYAYENSNGSKFINFDESWAHNGMSIYIRENYTNFWLFFSVDGSTEKKKVRGPYDNSRDVCWRFHGSKDPPGLSWLETNKGIRKSKNRLDDILWLTENEKQRVQQIHRKEGNIQVWR
ncbi:36194_t:CDS:2 [Gigaspora margarita]|uniref:36194_t:CDS:1 n=1 Tax=Gigaspora margarita TaxID=4874 RepID=A0ABN7UT44_GIGMA|nr:36194_t:CDS:2 [Gigaspora margarita]